MFVRKGRSGRGQFARLFAARLALAVLGLLVWACGALATELKIATWNLNWLTLHAPGDRALPQDVHPRADGDFERLRSYAAELNADVVAIEEVDGRAAAQLVFPRERYSIHLTHDDVVQRVGFAVRRGLHYDVNPDYAALVDAEPNMHLRSGADITLRLPAGPLRLLAVHLKTGCFEGPVGHARRAACQELAAQLPPLEAWIAARRDEGVAFVVLGDFNRRMDGADPFWSALSKAAPLVRATEGYVSPCWGRESFIDHILVGGAARDWLVPGSLRVLTYREAGEAWKERLSDHCPVSVRLRVPE